MATPALIVNMADFANLSLLPLGPVLRRKLDEAVVVASDDVPADVLTMQSEVVLLDESSGERRSRRLVYPDEAQGASDAVSVLDPLGMELFGARLGDTIECGSRYRIVEMRYQPESSMRTHVVVRSEREAR
jgi:regulator of nucleoside diphosphate kinase